MLGVLPVVEDPDLSWSAAPALPQHLPPWPLQRTKILSQTLGWMIRGSGRWEIILFVNVFTRRCLRERNQCLATVKKYYASLLIYSHCVQAKLARKQEWINSLRLRGMIHNRDRQYHISLQYLHLVHTIRFLPPTYQVGVRNVMKGGGGCRACRGCASRFSIWITPSPIDPSAQPSLHT